MHEELTEKIIGVFFDVYNELGYGFLESVYEKAMMIALESAALKVQQQVATPVWFRSRQIADFHCDLVVENKVLLELKAAKAIEKSHEANC